jgi:hypothetical protein
VESGVHPLRFVLVSPVSKDGFAVKKILSLVALCAFLFVVVGCNETKPTTGAKAPAPAPTDKKGDK